MTILPRSGSEGREGVGYRRVRVALPTSLARRDARRRRAPAACSPDAGSLPGAVPCGRPRHTGVACPQRKPGSRRTTCSRRRGRHPWRTSTTESAPGTHGERTHHHHFGSHAALRGLERPRRALYDQRRQKSRAISTLRRRAPARSVGRRFWRPTYSVTRRSAFSAITSCSFSRERFQPETLGVLLRHFVVTESPPPAA